jgi:hypothetical protein
VRRLADRVVYLDRRVLAWGPPGDVLSRDWERGAFHGNDHAAPAQLLCEGDE